jgi:hypothetical protein
MVTILFISLSTAQDNLKADWAAPKELPHG